MFGKSNIDFRLDIHNQRLNFLEGLVMKQQHEIELLRQKKETEAPKQFSSWAETLTAHDKLKEELAEAKLKNKSLETSLNGSYDTIEAECRTANKLREENKKLSREVEALKDRVDYWKDACSAALDCLSETAREHNEIVRRLKAEAGK